MERPTRIESCTVGSARWQLDIRYNSRPLGNSKRKTHRGDVFARIRTQAWLEAHTRFDVDHAPKFAGDPFEQSRHHKLSATIGKTTMSWEAILMVPGFDGPSNIPANALYYGDVLTFGGEILTFAE